jgi:curved DNA-binding protein CbpA
MNYYELFGLTPDATDEELEAAYLRLREQYREERWLDGEAGNEAARKLTQLEAAYKELTAERKQQRKTESGTTDSYEEISRLLKEGKINEAQSLLDEFNERTAEWHYLQAVVFYKKNWMNESKKQLEIAMQMDPNCVKYRDAYGKLNAKAEYDSKQKREQPNNPYSTEQSTEEPQQMGGGNLCSNCCSCCYTYLCIDCLFSMCCGCR